MIDSTTVAASDSGASDGITSAAVLGLDGEHDGGGRARRIRRRIEAQPASSQCRKLTRRLRLDHDHSFGIEPERKPAVQHGAAHLAGADQHDGAGQPGERARAVG